jgi:hypothetical protein
MSGRHILLQGLLTLSLCIISVVGYHLVLTHYLLPKPLKIGMVDIGSIVRKKEVEFTKLVSATTSTDKDREKAIEGAQAFSRQFGQILSELPAQCGCVVLPRSAIASDSPEVINLTPVVMQRVGIAP